MRASRWLHAVVVTTVVGGFLAVPLSGTASAAVSCEYNGADKTVLVTFDTEGDTATIARKKGKITVDDTACGKATVGNTDEINVDGGGLGTGETLTIELGRDGFGDVDFNVTNFGDAGQVIVEGSDGPDIITAGRGPLILPNIEKGGVDLDGDLDADLLFCGTVDDCDTTGFADSGVTSITVKGNDGDDRLSAAGGGTIDDLAGASPDTPVVLDGGDGHDILDMTAAPDFVEVNLIAGIASGANFIGNVECIVGTRFDDTLVGDDYPNCFYGGPGDDVITGLHGNDFIDGGVGLDTVRGDWGEDEIHGGPGDDDLSGGDGFDRIFGGDGLDILTGGLHDDHLEGNAGEDDLGGNEGNDVLIGGDGSDTFDGHDGDDLFFPGAVDDAVTGGPGFDTVDFSDSPKKLKVNVVTGEVEGDGFDSLQDVEKIIGSAHDDSMTGNDGPNVLIGGGGNDSLAGGDGDDVLLGGDGDDTFDEATAANGADEIVGGAGNDKVNYSTRETGITATSDGVANDGAPGERDNIKEVEQFELPKARSGGGALQPLSADSGGYWLAAADGGIFSFGDARFFGSTGGMALNQPVVAMAATPSLQGYWLAAADGGIFSFGDAGFFGSTGDITLNRPIVGMTPTPTGQGYWLVAADGGIFAFGDAPFLGSTGAVKLNKPIVGMAATPSGQGYWLVASDGGVFTFGDAPFAGSLGRARLRGRIVGMAPTATGQGYWLAGSDGAVSAFGDAEQLGAPASPPAGSIAQIASFRHRKGYVLVAGDGASFAFGDTGPLATLVKASNRLNQPIVGAAAF